MLSTSTEYNKIPNIFSGGGNKIDGNHIYVWTCAFRRDAKENSITQIRNLRKLYPDAKITICGCMPSIAPYETERLAKEVDANVIPWKREQEFFDNARLKECDTVCVMAPLAKDIEKYKAENPDKPISFADQFIKLCISEGCTCDCAYCSEKHAFPKYKSFSIKDLTANARKIVDETGYKRLILVADSPGEYGRDIGCDIRDLMDALYAIDGGIQIALSNFHPYFFLKYLDYFQKKIQEKKICHVNLPIQSASTRMLESMKRRYTRADLTRIFDAFCRMDYQQFDTHVLVGYDGETIDDFEETVEFLCQYKLRYVLASKYMSIDDGTIRENVVSEEEKQRRCEYLVFKVREYGGIINYEGSDLSKDRWRRLNKGGRHNEK